MVTGTFTPVSDELLARKDLSSTDKFVYARLARYGNIRPSQSQLAELLGVSIRAVIRSTQTLEALGLLTAERKLGSKRRNIYRLKSAEVTCQSVTSENRTAETVICESVTSEADLQCQSVTSTKRDSLIRDTDSTTTTRTRETNKNKSTNQEADQAALTELIAFGFTPSKASPLSRFGADRVHRNLVAVRGKAAYLDDKFAYAARMIRSDHAADCAPPSSASWSQPAESAKPRKRRLSELDEVDSSLVRALAMKRHNIPRSINPMVNKYLNDPKLETYFVEEVEDDVDAVVIADAALLTDEHPTATANWVNYG